MPNDYDVVLNVLDESYYREESDVFTVEMNPAGYTNFPAANLVMFDQSGASAPLSPSTFPYLTWVTGNIMTRAEANAIFTSIRERGVFVGVKVIYLFKVQERGFSEVWYQDVTDASVPTLAGLVSYVQRRLAFSGAETTFQRVRVSTIGSRFANRIYTAQQLQANGLPFTTGQFTMPVTAAAAETDEAEVALICNCTSGQRSRRMFLRGIPDAIIQRGGQYVNVGTFQTRFESWASYLSSSISPYGWFGQPGGGNPRVQITNIVSAGGQLTFTLAGPGIFSQVAGQWQNTAVRVRGLPHPWGFLNGPLTVLPSSAVAATAIRTMPVPGAPPPALPVTSQMYLQKSSTFYPMTSMGIDHVGTREAGRVFGVSPGRRPNRQWS